MITHAQYLSLKFGDEVEIACQDKAILDGECYYDFPNATFEWFKVAGISNGCIAVFVPINSGINSRWPWSSGQMEEMKINDSMFDRKTTEGYWVSLHPIRAIRRTSLAAEKSKAQSSIPIPCLECKQFYPYAEPNYGKELVCWSCRDSLGWKYGKDVTGQVFLKK